MEDICEWGDVCEFFNFAYHGSIALFLASYIVVAAFFCFVYFLKFVFNSCVEEKFEFVLLGTMNLLQIVVCVILLNRFAVIYG